MCKTSLMECLGGPFVRERWGRDVHKAYKEV